MTSDTTHPMSRLLSQRPQGPMRSPARVLGWFSIGLGLAELAMPRLMARAAGAPLNAGLVRACGVREIAVGVGLLMSRDPAPWLWGRVAGDALDAAALGTGLVGRRPVRALASMAVVGGIMAIDTRCASAAGAGPRLAVRDYSDRSGFPRPAAEMRGAARKPLVAAEPPHIFDEHQSTSRRSEGADHETSETLS